MWDSNEYYGFNFFFREIRNGAGLIFIQYTLIPGGGFCPWVDGIG
jgi:hypothetical protein